MRRRATLTAGQRNELGRRIKESEKTGEVRRAQAVLLYHDGASFATIESVSGYSERHVLALSTRFRSRGAAALVDRRIRKPKELLTRRQRQAVVEILSRKTPRNFGYLLPFWTTKVLGEVIEKRFRVRYKSRTSYYLLFRKATFSYHLPPTRYREQDHREVTVWRKAAKKRVTEAWNHPDTAIIAGDEMVLTTATTTQRVWLPQGSGDVPVVEVANGGRKRRSIYGFLNLKTGTEHAWKTTRQNMHETVRILKKLRARYPMQRMLLLWDSAGWHKGSAVQAFLANDGRIDVLPFPRYAPEENPQEHVWKSGRAEATHNRFLEDIDAATDEFVQYLRRTKFPYSLLGFTAVSTC